MTMNLNAVRDIIGPYLRTSSLLQVRILIPLFLYFWLSLIFSMVRRQHHLLGDALLMPTTLADQPALQGAIWRALVVWTGLGHLVDAALGRHGRAGFCYGM